MNKNEFDRLFDDACDKVENATDTFSTDYRPSYAKVKKRIRAIEKRRTIKRSFRRISVIVASLLLGATIFSSIPVTKAFYPFYQTLKELPGEIATLFFGNQDKTDSNGAKTAPPTEGKLQQDGIKNNIKGESKTVTVSLEEARKQVNFDIPTFGYIPASYELRKTELLLLPGESSSTKVTFTFKDQENNTFWVTLIQLEDNTTIGSGANKEQMQKVQLKYGTGYLVIAPDGSSRLEFLKGNIYVSILGTLSKNDLIRLAENL